MNKRIKKKKWKQFVKTGKITLINRETGVPSEISMKDFLELLDIAGLTLEEYLEIQKNRGDMYE